MFLDLGNRIVSIPHIETILFDTDKTKRATVKLFSGDSFTVTPEAAGALRFVFDKNLMPNVLTLKLAYVMKNRERIEQALAADQARQAGLTPVPPADSAGGDTPVLPGLNPPGTADINKLGDIQELVSQLNAYVTANPVRTPATAEPSNVTSIQEGKKQ